MLDVDRATPYLLERGLIDVDWIIDGQLTINSEARRNRNLRVVGPDGRGVLIKQPEYQSASGHSSLEIEAAFCRHWQERPDACQSVAFIPRLLDHDAQTATLVFELIPGASVFAAAIVNLSERARATVVAEQLGTHLATVHRSYSGATIGLGDQLGMLRRDPPWAMQIHEPIPAMLTQLSAGNYALIHQLQSEQGLAERIDLARHDWRPLTVIHGDMKFDNIVVQTERNSGHDTSERVWIVDWEMAQIGDPGWDLAGVFQDFLVLWIRSMPTAHERAAEVLISQAAVPLAALRGPLLAFWNAYRASASLTSERAAELLRRSIQFSAVRLVQTAYEMCVSAHTFAGPAVFLLQIAANILTDPRRGQFELYGIPSPSTFP
jgi:aminoglycoside phosphotransferase